jgi:hypothetical protein
MTDDATPVVVGTWVVQSQLALVSKRDDITLSLYVAQNGDQWVVVAFEVDGSQQIQSLVLGEYPTIQTAMAAAESWAMDDETAETT